MFALVCFVGGFIAGVNVGVLIMVFVVATSTKDLNSDEI